MLDPNEGTRWTVVVSTLLLLIYAALAGPLNFYLAQRAGRPLASAVVLAGLGRARAGQHRAARDLGQRRDRPRSAFDVDRGRRGHGARVDHALSRPVRRARGRRDRACRARQRARRSRRCRRGHARFADRPRRPAPGTAARKALASAGRARGRLHQPGRRREPGASRRRRTCDQEPLRARSAGRDRQRARTGLELFPEAQRR